MVGEGIAFPAHTVETFLKYNEQQLRQKRLLANVAIRAARESLEDGDERAPRALEYYLEERRLINEALQRKVHGEEGPPAQEIALKALTMAGAAKRDSGQSQRLGVASLDEFLRLFEGGSDGGR